MKLIKLHIENFGKLSNVDIDFSSGLNEIYKENGWGKTTLGIFIKSMFYSMGARARGDLYKFERTHYLPWQGGKYGGFIDFETEQGKYRITRYFEKTPEGDFYELKNLETNKTSSVEETPLGETLFEIGRESFEVTAFFPQLKITSMSTAQITASLTGVDKFQNDLASVNQAVKIIDGKLTLIKKQKPKKEEFAELKRKIDENLNLIDDKKFELEKDKKLLQEIDEERVKLEKELSNAKENFDLKNKSFLNKMNLEKSLNSENEKFNTLLQKFSALKDKRIEKEKEENSNKKGLTKIFYLTSIPFVMILVLLAVLLAINIIPMLIGIVLLLGLLAGFTVTEFLVFKRKNFRTKNSVSASIEEELRQCESEIKTQKKLIDSLKNQIFQYGEIESPDGEMVQAIVSAINDKKIEKNKLENTNFLNMRSIDELIEINDKLSSDLVLLKEREDEVLRKTKLLQDTKGFLLSAKENVSKRFIVPVNREFKAILSKFTDINKEFAIDTELKIMENTNFGSKEYEYSSQGIQDIISFCQRINLIKQIYKKEKPFIILDDTFVNLDDNKLKIAKEIVETLSKEYQIIYICCNERCEIDMHKEKEKKK